MERHLLNAGTLQEKVKGNGNKSLSPQANIWSAILKQNKYKMNKENILNLKFRSSLRIVRIKEGITIAIPTLKKISDAMVLEINEDGSFTAHYNSNFNTSGDFRTELMVFTNELILDDENLKERNKIRKSNGLIKIN